FAVQISRFYGAFQGEVLVINSVGALAVAGGGGAVLAFPVFHGQSLLLHGFHALSRHVRFYVLVHLGQNGQLIFVQGSAHVSFYAAGAFAFIQVADKELIFQVVREDGVLQYYHSTFYLSKRRQKYRYFSSGA